MFNFRTIAVIKRELREKLLSKTFIIMTVLLPIFMFGILGVQTLLMTFEGDSNTHLEIAAGSPELTSALEHNFSRQEFIKSGYYKIDFKTVGRSDLTGYINSVKSKLLNDKLTGVVFVPDSALLNKKVEYYSKTPNNNTVFRKLSGTINQTLSDLYFKNKNISQQDINYAKESVDFNSYRVSKEAKIEEAGYGNQIVSFLFTFLLYFSLLFLGTMMMRSVIEEKTNRIVEILLSSVDSRELMTGKIIGTSITGLFQMAIWLLPLIVLISTTWFALPPELIINISISQVLYFLLNYFIGLLTFLGLFATVGSIFDNDQDAQSGLWPIMMLIILPFFIAISMQSNPENIIAKVASMLPFASLIVMPARVALVDVPLWEFLVSIIISIGTLVVIFPLAGKIYRVGILMTGKKPKWSEVIGWLKYKY